MDIKAYNRGYRYFKYRFNPEEKEKRKWNSALFYWKKQGADKMVSNFCKELKIFSVLFPEHKNTILNIYNEIFNQSKSDKLE